MANLDFDLGGLDLQNMGKRTFLLISLVVFGSIIALIIWGIVPQVSSIFANRDLLVAVEQERNNLSQKLQQVQAIPNNPDFSQVDVVNNILYSDNPFLEVLYSINQVAKQNNVTFDRFEYSPGLVATPSAQFATKQTAQTAAARAAQAQNIQNQGFTIFIEARAAYHDLVGFLNELEDYAPFQSVAYSEITNNLLGIASARFEILAHYYSPDVRATLDEKLPQLTAADKQTLDKLITFKTPELEDLYQVNLVGGRSDLFTQTNIPQDVLDQALLDQSTSQAAGSAIQ